MDFKVLAAIGVLLFALFNPDFSLGGKGVVNEDLVSKPAVVIVEKYKADLNSIADIIAADKNKSDSDKKLVAMHFHYLGTSTVANPVLVKSTADVLTVNKETGAAIFTHLKVPSTPGLNTAVDSLLMKVGGDQAIQLEETKRREFIDVMNGISYVILNGRL